VVGGAAPAVEQPGPAQRVRAGADAGDGAAGAVVVGQAAQRLRREPPGVSQRRRPPAGHDDEVVGRQVGPGGPGPQRHALGGRHLVTLGDVGQPVVVAEVTGGREDLRRARQVQQVQARHQEEDHPSHDPVIIPRSRPGGR
jgi:hypothetical protein